MNYLSSSYPKNEKMYRFLFAIIASVGLSFNLSAQCTPDSLFVIDSQLISPSPFLNDSMGDGLPAACLDMPYEVTLFVRPPSAFVLAGTNIPVSSFQIDSVLNLPPGITYSCSTDDCFFLADSISCIYLSGTPSGDDLQNRYDLSIGITVSAIGLKFPVAFPDPTLAPGEYFIDIRNDSSCQTTATRDFGNIHSIAKVFPNPARDRIYLTVVSKVRSEGHLQIRTLAGEPIRTASVAIQPGSQEFNLDTSDLPVGLYLVGLQSSDDMHWSKFFKE